MALLASQITLINRLIADTTITDAEGVDLLSTSNKFSDAQIAFIQGLGLSQADEDLLLQETRITQNQLEQELESAKEAVRSGNYNEARKQILLAEMTLSGMSNYELGNRKVEYRDNLSSIKKSINEFEKKTNTDSLKNRRVVARHVRE
jgi:hypothetical protein